MKRLVISLLLLIQIVTFADIYVDGVNKSISTGGGSGGAVSSVNGQTGDVIITTDNTTIGTNKYVSDAEKTKIGVITTTGDGNSYLANNGTYKSVSTSSLVTYANTAALKAVNTTTYTTPVVVNVTGEGQFIFKPGVTNYALYDNVNVVIPTTGASAGTWVKQTIDYVPYTDALGIGYNRLNIKEGGETFSIKKGRTSLNRKIVYVGSSVMYGSGASDTATKSYASYLTTKLGSVSASNLYNLPVTTVNLGIGGNTPYNVVNRFVSDVVKENPDVVLIGLSTNNNGLYTANSAANAGKSISDYISNLNIIVKLCKQYGYEYYIVGEYGTGSITDYGKFGKKQINNLLSRLPNYFNVLGQITDDGCIWNTGTQTDNLHPNDLGHLDLSRGIDSDTLKYKADLYLNFKPTTNFSKILSTSAAVPLQFYPKQWNTIASLSDWTIAFNVRKNTGLNGITLCKIKSDEGTAGTELVVDANGFLAVKDNNVLTTTSTYKLDAITPTTIVIKASIRQNNIKVYANNTLISTYTPANSQLTMCYFFLGGNNQYVNYRAIDYEFNNLVVYNTTLDVATHNQIMYGIYPESNLYFCHDLQINDDDTALLSQNLNGTYATTEKTYWKSNLSPTTSFHYDDDKKLSTINAVGTAVASAATINIPENKSIIHVTGTTAISTINVPYTGFTGQITIIPDAVFTLSTGGNIAEAYTAVIGRAIQLIFDGTTWYRSNN